MLQTPKMAKLLSRFRSAYDVILVDSPPMAAGIDPLVLGTLTGALLIVCRTGATRRELVEAQLHMLGRLPIRVLGAVLNDVPDREIYRHYYGYTTLPGYEAADEPAVQAAGFSPVVILQSDSQTAETDTVGDDEPISGSSLWANDSDLERLAQSHRTHQRQVRMQRWK